MCASTGYDSLVSRLLADPRKNDIAQSARTSAVRQQAVTFSHHENESYSIHIASRLWSCELPILTVVNEDARLAVLGFFIGDTPISWILDGLGSGSVISSRRGRCKRVAALPNTQRYPSHGPTHPRLSVLCRACLYSSKGRALYDC